MDYFNRLKNATSSNGEQRGERRREARRRLIRDIVPPPGQEDGELSATRVVLPRRAPPPTPRAAKPPRKSRADAGVAPGNGHAKPNIPEPSTEPSLETVTDPDLFVRTWEPDAVRRARRNWRIFCVAGTGVAALSFLLPTVVFPKFSITIVPKIETVAVPRLELSANTAATAPEPTAKKIPALAVTVEKTLREEYEATGKKFVQERASGKVLLFNAFSSAPQTLVANTRLQDPSGKVFRLRETLTVPGAEVREAKIVPTSLLVDVSADGVGASYNIRPTEFRIPGFRGSPKYDGFYARSEQAFSGGYEGEARIVLAHDLEQASQDLTRRIVEELQAELGKKVPADPDFLVPDGAREVVVSNITQPRPGERLERFSVEVGARGRLLAIRRSELAETIAALLLSENPPLPRRLPLNQKSLTIESVRLGPVPSDLQFAVSGRLEYWHETDVPGLMRTLRASTPRKAEAYLRGREEIDSFRIKRFPRWLWYIPEREPGLEVKIQAPEPSAT